MRTVFEWDAATYDRVAAPMTERGTEMVERLPLAGGEHVIDLGCGTGRVTERLRERLPRGAVTALDSSRAMLDQAHARLGDDRVRYVQADLRGPLPVPPADALVSTSTLHWVPDHAGLFRRLAAALRPGGLAALDFGGHGNVDEVVRVLAVLEEPHPWTFDTLDATRGHLEAAGFEVLELGARERPHELEDREALERFLRTVVLAGHVASRPADEGERLVRQVADGIGEPRLRYVRTEVLARRLP